MGVVINTRPHPLSSILLLNVLTMSNVPPPVTTPSSGIVYSSLRTASGVACTDILEEGGSG
uniref:Uncharacterized protein n=1 Tax=Amphimedon queenslandica TaxID=400682 RepID=A0A1X7T2F2_AMPQE